MKETKEAKELIRDLFYMNVGAIASAAEYISDNAEAFREKGKEIAQKGKDLNEELKHTADEFLDNKKADEDKKEEKK